MPPELSPQMAFVRHNLCDFRLRQTDRNVTCPSCGHATYTPRIGCSTCSLPGETAPGGPHVPTLAVTPPPDDSTFVSPDGPPPFGARAPLPASGPLAPGQTFGTRYRILKLLGAGGMGVVYQAWDAELGVAVALKVIRPASDADQSAAADIERRFKRELLLARQVTHKHVVRIHDLGEVDGIKYLTMPYIEGRDLASTLAQAGKLPVAQVLSIGRQVASGLEAAHEVGVVHRDLKPANVMLDADGHAIILDFGIARSTTTTTMNATRGLVGTVEYMAPEQASGGTVDQHADIYAFGLLLYDLLAGKQRLASSETPFADLMKRLRAAPRPIREIEPHVPEGLGRVIMRCLEPDPAERFQTSTELAAALNGLDAEGHELQPPATVLLPVPSPRRPGWVPAAVMGGALLLAAGVAGGMRWGGAPGATPAAPRESVSVLIADFENRTGDQVFDGALEQALSLGVEDASFVTAFSRRDARRAADQIQKGAPIDEGIARLVAQREGVKIVLAGSIAPAGTGYRVSVRAIDPVPGAPIAEVQEDARGKSEVLQAVSAAAVGIREALGETPPDGSRTIARETFTAGSIEAAREYSLAQDLANQDRDEEAVAHYRRATELDANFGRAYSGWAASARKLGRREEAESLYQKAITLLDRMTEREKYRTLGAYYMQIARDYDKAIENYRTLIERYPADGAGHNNLAVAYFSVLDFARAREQGAKLLEIYPKSVLYRYNYALYAMYAGEFAAAAAEANKALELNPATPRPYAALALSAAADGRIDEARGVYEKARSAAGPLGASLASVGLADLALFQGRPAAAAPVLEAGIAADTSAKNQIGAATKLVALAEVRAATGDAKGTLEALDRAQALARTPAVSVPAALLSVEFGKLREAEAIGKTLDGQLTPQARAYGRLVAARLMLARNDVPGAVQALRDGAKLADLWLLRYWLGVALVRADAFPQALSELEMCEARRGEATAVFLDDVPSWRYTAPLHYWLARAREGTGQKAGAVTSYGTFLSLSPERRRGSLAEDASARLAALSGS